MPTSHFCKLASYLMILYISAISVIPFSLLLVPISFRPFSFLHPYSRISFSSSPNHLLPLSPLFLLFPFPPMNPHLSSLFSHLLLSPALSHCPSDTHYIKNGSGAKSRRTVEKGGSKGNVGDERTGTEEENKKATKGRRGERSEGDRKWKES